MPRHSQFAISLTAQEREVLGAKARAYTSPYCEVVRAKIVLLAAQGLRNDEIAARLVGIDRAAAAPALDRWTS